MPIAIRKTEEPCTVLTFLGVELDSDLMTVRLPAQKLDRLATTACLLPN